MEASANRGKRPGKCCSSALPKRGHSVTPSGHGRITAQTTIQLVESACRDGGRDSRNPVVLPSAMRTRITGEPSFPWPSPGTPGTCGPTIREGCRWGCRWRRGPCAGLRCRDVCMPFGVPSGLRTIPKPSKTLPLFLADCPPLGNSHPSEAGVGGCVPWVCRFWISWKNGTFEKRQIYLINQKFGEVVEWLMAPHSKCGVLARVSGVRIPPSPPTD